MSDKEKQGGLDADFIIRQTSKFHRDKPPESPQSPPPDRQEPAREESRRRKAKGQDYECLFIREVEGVARNGKTVNIREQHHQKITRIIQVIGGNKVSLFSYLDNVLEHHFNMFQDEITDLYKQRDKDIF